MTYRSSVLQSVNGDQDLAIDTLLGMSDPDYVSQPVPPPVQREPTQTDLDEQLARRLMLEEEQAAQPQWRPPQQGQGHQSFQPRRAATLGSSYDAGRYDSAAQRGNVPQRDTMAEFQDGFNKIAESTSSPPLISRVIGTNENHQLERRHFLRLFQRSRQRCRNSIRDRDHPGSHHLSLYLLRPGLSALSLNDARCFSILCLHHAS
jgi:hypothetical protein